MKGIVKLLPVIMMLTLVSFVGSGITPDFVDAKAKFGGKMYKKPAPKPSPQETQPATPGQNSGGFKRGLAGGLLGGAIGGLLFGSMMGGSGIGLLPILLLAAAGFFLFRRMGQSQQKRPGTGGENQFNPLGQQPGFSASGFGQPADTSLNSRFSSVEEGLAQIRESDPGFDRQHFIEVASDVFFKVQAGWMRKDLDAYRHLIGDTLRAEYAKHFEEMNEKGVVNKIESIAVRGVEIVDAGSDGKEDFITVLFTASLLDYTVDEKSGEIVEGSDTVPIKFDERWTWARPVRTEAWMLEGVHAGYAE